MLIPITIYKNSKRKTIAPCLLITQKINIMKAQDNKFKIIFHSKISLKFEVWIKEKHMQENLPNQNVSPSQTTSQGQSFQQPIINSRGLKPVIIGAIIALLIAVFTGGVYYFGTQRAKPGNFTTPTPQSPPTIDKISSINKFVYFERITEKVTNPQMAGGITYKDQFIIYDIRSQTKKVFYQESTTEDNVDQYHLFDNQNVAITSPKGNRVINLNGQVVTNYPSDYFFDAISPSENVRVKFKINENSIIFTVVNKQMNTQKDITMSNKFFLAPNVVGWSKDENFLFFTLIQTESTDPTHSLYQLDIANNKVVVFSRDASLTNIDATYINDKTDEIYFVTKKNIFKQTITDTKAIAVPLQNAHYGQQIVFPDNASNNSLALSDDQGLWLKTLDTGKEELLFQKTNDGSVRPISWKGNQLVFQFSREGYNTPENNQKYGQYIIGKIYNTDSKQIIEYTTHKSDLLQTVGRIYFIGWVE